MIIHKCDRCGKTSEQEKGTRCKGPDKWFEMRFNGYGGYWMYEICSDCKTLLKIPDDYKDATANVGERLIELIEEITQDTALAQ